MVSPRLSLIAAMSENRVIGKDNALPWHISADLKNFRRLTMGKPILMGRRTFESIGKPLPGRPNLVLTRDPDFRADGISICSDLDAALEQASAVAEACGADEVMVIGGAEIYAAALPRAERLYLTEVHSRIDGDAFFPVLIGDAWREVSRTPNDPESADGPTFSFVVLERVVTRAQTPESIWRKCISESYEAAQEELIGGPTTGSGAGNGQDA